MTDRIARLLTNLGAPTHLAAIVVLLVAWQSAPTTTSLLIWGGQALVFGALIPLTIIATGVRAGWWDRHIRDRSARRWPLLLCGASIATGSTLCLTWGGPRDLWALGYAMAATTVLLWAATDLGRGKPSGHTIVATVTAGILTLYYGWPAALVAWPLAAGIAWSRVRLGDHTLPQVAGGLALGAAALAVFFSIR